MNKNTILIYNVGAETIFLVLEGDHSSLDGAEIKATDHLRKHSALSELLYDQATGEYLHFKTELYSFPHSAYKPGQTVVIACSFHGNK